MPGQRRTATLIDVAHAAQVSRTTASVALGGTGRISPGTRARVRAVAESLGYIANPAARHLKAGRKGAIALYVPDHLTGYAFYMEFAFGAAQVARASGVALTLVAPAPGGTVGPLLAHVDAFLVVDPVAGDPFVRAMIESDVPVVAAERVLEGPQPTVTVETDHEGALLALLDHVWDQGARRPALLELDLPFAWARLVDDVFRRWCAQRGVPARLRAVPLDARPDAVRDVARTLIEDPEPPDAIVSAPDGTALGVLGAARDAGRRVGDDLLVASCVDSLAMQLATPPMTAIDLRPREIGSDVASVVLRLLAGEAVPDAVRRARPPLELRQSTGGHLRPGGGDA